MTHVRDASPVTVIEYRFVGNGVVKDTDAVLGDPRNVDPDINPDLIAGIPKA